MNRIRAYETTGRDYTSGGEIDLRGELDRMYSGSSQEIPKGWPALLRRARRDSSGNLVACDCVDPITREPDVDGPCPLCGPYGDGYLWDEEWVTIRRLYIRPSNTGFVSRDVYLDPGVINIQAIVFYLEWDVEPTSADRLVEVRLDTEGDPVIPYIRTRIYRPETVGDHRSDNGRVEFWSMYCMQRDSIELGATVNASH